MAPGPEERPVIGVTAYDEQASWGHWKTKASLVPSDYLRSLVDAGASPLILPVQHEAGATLDTLLQRLDGLVLTGGPDVDPARYGAEAHPRSQAPRPERDESELALIEAAERCGLPLLAICRGMQLVNVARGGTLVQHLPEVLGHEEHNPTPGTFSTHMVRVAPGSSLRKALGWDARDVPTHHHQGIDRLADGLSAVAWADDGTVEAIEDPKKPFCIGVQWHPEADDNGAVFHALVRAAAGVLAEREKGRRSTP
ncbi:MAG: gamma-glutamyl-gamma-aminobutyrate hydrolase family protein [Acidimicrobiales bacterium]|jgi:gamma-glutamyl-gamma-aminobutyrate hydrolase PuuD